MSCLVCHEQRDLTGVACAECLDELQTQIAITPEQVRIRGTQPTKAALVDRFGRILRLHATTMIGRELEGEGLLIFDATISRKHASLELRGGAWTVRDLGSANGTFVENAACTTQVVRDGERLRFGSVALFFLDDVGSTPEVDFAALDGFTVRGPVDMPKAKAEPPAKDIVIELREPTGGGGGLATFDGKQLQLTLAQFELVSILHQRATATGDARFVHPQELVRQLSLDSAVPNEDHVRQLVRRLRRALFKAGITNVIESRYGVGYRLRLRGV